MAPGKEDSWFMLVVAQNIEPDFFGITRHTFECLCNRLSNENYFCDCAKTERDADHE